MLRTLRCGCSYRHEHGHGELVSMCTTVRATLATLIGEAADLMETDDVHELLMAALTGCRLDLHGSARLMELRKGSPS